MENKELQRQKFYDNNIPFEDIDPEMIDIIDVLNFQCGYKTEFCCYGHDDLNLVQIIFDSKVSDKMMYKLINHIHSWHGNPQIQMYGHFTKWARILKDGLVVYNIDNSFDIKFNKKEKLKTNWLWEGIYNRDESFINEKREYINKFLKCLQDFKP